MTKKRRSLVSIDEYEDGNFSQDGVENSTGAAGKEADKSLEEAIKNVPEIYADMSLIAPSKDNMMYRVNMENYEQARIILDKLKQIDPDILNKPTGLSEAMVMDEESPFYPVLKQYKGQQGGALRLLSFTGNIRSEGMIESPGARRNHLVTPGEPRFVLLGGMKRYLALKILGEKGMFIRVLDKEAERDLSISIIENIQSYKPTDIELGQSIDDLKKRKPWESDERIAQNLGISRNRVQYCHKKFKDYSESSSKKDKPKTVKQTIIDSPDGKFTYSGPEKINSEILYEDPTLGFKILGLGKDRINPALVNAIREVIYKFEL